MSSSLIPSTITAESADLRRAWTDVRSVWGDRVAEDFETSFIEPLLEVMMDFSKTIEEQNLE